MHWFFLACSLGALGALLKYWQWPYANLVALSGLALLLATFFKWLRSSAAPRRRGGTGDGWLGSDVDTGCDSGGWGGDCGSSDGGGCGGGDGGGD